MKRQGKKKKKGKGKKKKCTKGKRKGNLYFPSLHFVFKQRKAKEKVLKEGRGK